MFTACGYLHFWDIQLCLSRNNCPAHFTTGWDIFSPHSFLFLHLAEEIITHLSLLIAPNSQTFLEDFCFSSNVYATFARLLFLICVLSSRRRWLSLLKQLVVLLPCLHLYRKPCDCRSLTLQGISITSSLRRLLSCINQSASMRLCISDCLLQPALSRGLPFIALQPHVRVLPFRCIARLLTHPSVSTPFLFGFA